MARGLRLLGVACSELPIGLSRVLGEIRVYVDQLKLV